jgi:hypothetical protein
MLRRTKVDKTFGTFRAIGECTFFVEQGSNPGLTSPNDV